MTRWISVKVFCFNRKGMPARNQGSFATAIIPSHSDILTVR